MKKQSLLFVSLVLFASSQVFAAQTTVCKNGKMERRIEVSSTDATKSTPCEVKYFKDVNEAGQVLWNAQNDAQYCETKAKEFTDKLATMSWNCSTDGQTTSTTKTETPATTPAPATPATPAK